MTAALTTSSTPAVGTLREAQAQLGRLLVAADAEIARLEHLGRPWLRNAYSASARTVCERCGACASVSLNAHRLDVSGAALKLRCPGGDRA